MMKRKLNWLLIVSLFCSCQSKIDAPLSEEKLLAVLVDIHTAEALTEGERQNVRDSMNRIYYAQIFEHHGIRKQDFDSTMTIYAHVPERFDSVYSRVERLINQKKDTTHVQ